MTAGRSEPSNCFVCKAPYHPATGGLHWVEYTQRYVAFCGVCEKDFVKWIVNHIKGTRKRVMGSDGKKKYVYFYDNAHPPKE